MPGHDRSPDKKFKWTARTLEAASLLAEGQLEDREIARRAGVTPKTIQRWKEHPDFAARVEEIVTQITDATLRGAVRSAEQRVAAHGGLLLRMHKLMEARAANPDVPDDQGGRTGLVVRQFKMAGGRNPIVREEFVFDAAFVREYRGILDDSAKHLGQLKPQTIVFTPDAIDAEIARIEQRLAELGIDPNSIARGSPELSPPTEATP